MQPFRFSEFHGGQEAETSTGCVDKLALKYMEMCKVESSTDSGSDTSPRWSDTSAKGCASSGHERHALRKASFVPKPAGHHHLVRLDPYDGSSEDSEEPSGPRAHWHMGSRMHGRGWRETGKGAVRAGVMSQVAADVPMRSSSDSEAWTDDTGFLSLRSSRPRLEETPTDSGVRTESELSMPGLSCTRVTPPADPSSPSHLARAHKLHPRSPESPSADRNFSKRKLSLPGAESGERDLRKRQRVMEMEVDDVREEPRE
ncbi:uncharacterized protein LOC108941474 [Scleropages formosus]|uniref:uncharacterized protein LOC108941474 n=1 Tax=Scleropages formosus TaxID=113540 RepID=UPI0010FA9A2E|nr:uncharacterized protein LOC108941474 [Scleropages formosus]